MKTFFSVFIPEFLEFRAYFEMKTFFMVFSLEFEEKSFCAPLKIVYAPLPSHTTLAPGLPHIYIFLKKVMLTFLSHCIKKHTRFRPEKWEEE